MLKKHLYDHSIQRPPFAIEIFSLKEAEAIIFFSQQTFLRHFSLYEFAFKPRVDLILRTVPIMNTQFNSKLSSLQGMTEVDPTETK